MSERTLVLIKPDGVKRGLIGDVIARVERKGLKVVAMDLRTLDADTAKAHYAEHSERPFFGELVEFFENPGTRRAETRLKVVTVGELIHDDRPGAAPSPSHGR